MAMKVPAPVAGRQHAWRLTPCPACEDQRFIDAALPADGHAGELRCSACEARFEGVVAVTCTDARQRSTGGCCAGFRRHWVAYRRPAAADVPHALPGSPEIAFEVWSQDPVRIRAGDVVTILFDPGAKPRRGDPGRRCPAAVANLTLGQYWPLVAPSR